MKIQEIVIRTELGTAKIFSDPERLTFWEFWEAGSDLTQEEPQAHGYAVELNYDTLLAEAYSLLCLLDGPERLHRSFKDYLRELIDDGELSARNHSLDLLCELLKWA